MESNSTPNHAGLSLDEEASCLVLTLRIHPTPPGLAHQWTARELAKRRYQRTRDGEVQGPIRL